MMYFYFYSDYLFVYAVSCHFLCKSRLFYLLIFHLSLPPGPPGDDVLALSCILPADREDQKRSPFVSSKQSNL